MKKKKIDAVGRGLNLRPYGGIDFKSIALNTRPQLPQYCYDPNCSFGGRRITRKYEHNKATRKSCSVTGQDAHIRYSPYMARRPLERVTMTSKRDSAIQHDNT